MKTHWSLRYSLFIFSVISLSWFFAGWRGINEHGSVADWATLIGGTTLTIGLLAVQGYWIYIEELKKGSLRRHIPLFDRIHGKLNPAPIQQDVAQKKGDL